MAEKEPLRGSPPESAKCCATVFSHYTSNPCGRKAKITENGKHYCGIHDPLKDRIKRKRRAEEREAWRAKWNAADAKKRRDAARLDLWPELVAMLADIESRYGSDAAKASGVSALLAKARKIDVD